MKLLESLGYKVDWNAYHMGHTMSLPEVQDLSAWLTKLLA